MDTPQNFEDLSPEELAAKEAELVAQFDQADQADDLDAMAAAATQIDSVRAAINAAAPAEDVPADPVTASGPDATSDAPVDAEPSASAADTAPVPPADPEPTTEDPAPAEDPAPNSDEPAPDSADPQPTNDSGSDPKEEHDMATEIPEDRQPEVAEPTGPVSTVTAGAGLPNISAGIEFRDRMQVNESFVKKLDAVSRSKGGDGEQITIATITASVGEDRFLDGDGGGADMAKIDAIVRPEAITASGGYCAPLETRYDLFGTGSTARPVRDALAGFQAKRGGIRFSAAPKIADFSGALGLWTAANDANPTSPTEKPCMEVECAPEVTATIDAITLCLKFGNLMTRAYPELVDRNNQLALVAHARFAERTLLDKMTALSTSVTSAFKLGAARDFLNAIGRAAAAYRNRYRMDPNQPLRVVAPVWVLDMMREDLAYQAPGDDTLAVADATISAYLSARNVNVSWHLDGTGFSDEVAASTLDEFPASFSWYIYAEGAFLYLDGGTLDLGIVRDSELVGTNDYKTFTESFEGVARIGAESIRVTTTTGVAGAYAAGTDTGPQVPVAV